MTKRRPEAAPEWKLNTPDALVVIAAETFRANVILSTDKDVIRLEGNLGLRAKIGPPATGLDLPLFDQGEIRGDPRFS